jgi:hypothetical protein
MALDVYKAVVDHASQNLQGSSDSPSFCSFCPEFFSTSRDVLMFLCPGTLSSVATYSSSSKSSVRKMSFQIGTLPLIDKSTYAPGSFKYVRGATPKITPS